MACSQEDMDDLCVLNHIQPGHWSKLYNSKLYLDESGQNRFSIAGPFIGAPYAVMLLEIMIKWGARKIIIFGFCGAVSPDVKIGDIVIPTGSIIDEKEHRGII